MGECGAVMRRLRRLRRPGLLNGSDSFDKIAIYCEFAWKFQFFFLSLHRNHNILVIMDQKEIGTVIKERRKHLGVNQQTLADLAGVGINTLVAIERGEGNPQLSTLLTILDTLGLQLDLHIKTLTYEAV